MSGRPLVIRKNIFQRSDQFCWPFPCQKDLLIRIQRTLRMGRRQNQQLRVRPLLMNVAEGVRSCFGRQRVAQHKKIHPLPQGYLFHIVEVGANIRLIATLLKNHPPRINQQPIPPEQQNNRQPFGGEIRHAFLSTKHHMSPIQHTSVP
jgi:hypothetical protein